MEEEFTVNLSLSCQILYFIHNYSLTSWSTIRKHVERSYRKSIEKGDVPGYLWKRVVRMPVGDGDQSPIRSPSVVSAT